MNNTNAASHGGNRLSFASSVNEIVVTVWAGASFYLMCATGGKSEFVLFFPLAIGAAALVWMTYKKPAIARVDRLLSLGVFLLIFSILASYLFNSQRYEPLFIAGNFFSAVLLFISLYAITTKIDLDFRKTLVFLCIFASPLLPFVLATSHLEWGRVTPAELPPNFVGMMALLCFVGACSVRSWLAAIALSVLPLYTIVVMESRDSMLAVGVAAPIIMGYRLSRLGWKKLRPYVVMALLGGPIICIGLYFVGIDLFGYANRGVENLFMLNDEHRGISSGGSGRTELWNAAIQLWLSHPLFGVGFKGVEPLMPDQLPVHNAYLSELAEVGLVGFTGYLLIVGVALYYTLKRGDRGLSEYPQRVAILVSYVIYGMLESRAFSFGNSYSVLFLLVAFDSSKIRLTNSPVFEPPQTIPSPEQPEPGSSRA